MFVDECCKKKVREKDFNKYERVWKRRIRQCESANQKFKEREWKRVEILIGFREWNREAWNGVVGSNMLTLNASRKRVRKRG
jgi:hypothetical protein